jgi:hypothetical protein
LKHTHCTGMLHCSVYSSQPWRTPPCCAANWLSKHSVLGDVITSWHPSQLTPYVLRLWQHSKCVLWWNMLGASNCRCSCTMCVLSASTRTLRRHLHTDRRLCLVPFAVPCLLLFAVCAPGRYGATCAECVSGSYCPGGQDAPIVSCGSNRSSAAGAPSQASCYCAPGEPLSQPVSNNSSCRPRVSKSAVAM